jgi:N-methylhydantoinase A/oxoprolinase/acetone carboxylase beta subunit
MIIGLDVGGTHTDAVLLDEEGLVRETKVLTDPADLFQTVLACLESITAGLEPNRIDRIVLSTTLTTNAIVERKLPPVGMIVSSGPGIDPLAHQTNPHYYPVEGSIDHRGREVAPLNEKQIQSVADTLETSGIRNVGVVGKFSVRNPRHEFQIFEQIRNRFDRVFMGHQVSGGLNFARRIATTYLNAAVYPIHHKFFDAVHRSLQEKGLAVPLSILKADGGTVSLTASMDFPGQTTLSGPAASVMGAIGFTPRDRDAMVLDIGGTTTDMAVIRSGIPLLHPVGIRLGGFRTLIRSLETRSIGIGGDSAVRIIDGQIVIGPEREGPALAFGGPLPTPTDALIALGWMTEGDQRRAVQGIEALAAALGRPREETARAVFDHACRAILAEAHELVERINNRPVYTVQDLQSGDRVSPKELLILGGPAAFFARHLAAVSDYAVRTVPHWQVANAVGAALARTTCEVTLFADTQLGVAVAPEEDFSQSVDHRFTIEAAVQKAYELLKRKALHLGAGREEPEMEILEEQQFNMVRGFRTTGKNMRIKVQVKPGLIAGCAAIVEKLANLDRS